MTTHVNAGFTDDEDYDYIIVEADLDRMEQQYAGAGAQQLGTATRAELLAWAEVWGMVPDLLIELRVLRAQLAAVKAVAVDQEPSADRPQGWDAAMELVRDELASSRKTALDMVDND